MAGNQQHYNGNDLEIDSEIDGLQFCVKCGALLIYTEDKWGDVGIAHIPLKELKKFINEIEELREVYYEDVHNMVWFGESE